jgi:hypothetical protein
LFLGFLNFEREEKEILGTKEGECMKEWKDTIEIMKEMDSKMTIGLIE